MNNIQENKAVHTIIAILVSSCLLLFSLGCGGATEELAPLPAGDATQEPAASPGPGVSEASPEPFDIEAALSREFAPLPTVEITDPDGTWRARVEAKGTPAIALDEEGTGTIAIPVGTEGTVDCFVYKQAKDLGGTIGQMFELTGNSVTYHKVATTLVDVVGSYAMMEVTGLYTISQNGHQAAGLFKLAMWAHPTRSVLCYHDELGYSESFERVVKGLLSSFQLAKEAPRPDYAEVWTASLSGMPIGFTQISINAEKNGNRTYEDRSTMIIPRSAQQIKTNDRITTAESDKKGQIIKKSSINIEGTAIESDMLLTRTQKRKYRYKGKFQGKDLEGTFSASKKLGFPDSVTVMARIKKAFQNGKDDAFQVTSYLPSLAPDKLTETKYEIFGTKTPKTFLNHMGELTFTGTAEENGDVTKLTMPMGTVSVVLERIYAHGDILEL